MNGAAQLVRDCQRSAAEYWAPGKSRLTALSRTSLDNRGRTRILVLRGGGRMNPLSAQEPTLRTDPAFIADEEAPRPTPPTSHARFVVGAVVVIAALGIIAWFIARPSLPPLPPAREEGSSTRPPPEAMAPRAEIRHP